MRDIYIPRDHYTREPRGFAFVEFLDDRDARDAMEGMDRREIDGREVITESRPHHEPEDVSS